MNQNIKPEINGRINKTNSQKKTEIEQARTILKTLGHKVAVRYMQLRGWSLEGVLWELFKVEARA